MIVRNILNTFRLISVILIASLICGCSLDFKQGSGRRQKKYAKVSFRDPAIYEKKIDEGITSDIQSEIEKNPKLSMRKIEIQANGRIVTISGIVKSTGEKRKVLEIARNTREVIEVISKIKIVLK